MKKIVFILVVTVFASSLWASSGKKGVLRSLYDVVAPVLTGDPAASDRQVGQIFYDNTVGAYKGVNKSGGIDTFKTSADFPKAKAILPSENLLDFGMAGTDPSHVPFGDEEYDTHNAFDPATGRFTAPSAGYYNISAYLKMGASITGYLTGDSAFVYIEVNDSSAYTEWTAVETRVNANTGQISLAISSDVYLEAGDFVNLELTVVASGQQTAPVNALAGWANFKKLP